MISTVPGESPNGPSKSEIGVDVDGTRDCDSGVDGVDEVDDVTDVIGDNGKSTLGNGRC